MVTVHRAETDNNHLNIYSSENTTNNSSGLGVAASHIKTFSVVIYCLITVVGTVGNGMVVYVTGFKMKRTVNSVWFLNLAIADFLFTTFLIFFTVSLYQDNIWPFGNFMCKLNTFMSVINMFASVFFLMAISLDRCLSIWVVVWAQNKRTVCKAQIISAVIWITAGICSTPYATFRTLRHGDYDDEDYGYENENENDTRYCFYPVSMTDESRLGLTIFRFVVGFIIPFLVVLVSYVAIAIRARRLQRSGKPRSHRIIVSIISAFFICWLPFHVLNLMELHSKFTRGLNDIIHIIGSLTLCLAYMNSCLNPILYVFIGNEFQKKLKQSICLVLEIALAEDHMLLMSARSLQSHFLSKSSKLGSVAPMKEKCEEM